MNRNHSGLIFENPIIFTSECARIVGVNCAIVIQKLQFLITCPDSGKEVDGEKWIYNTYEEWKVKYFPFWSEDTIERIFTTLERVGLVASLQPDGKLSRRKYYRVTEAGLKTINRKHLPEDRKLRVTVKDGPDHRKLRSSDHRKLRSSCAGASSLTENTTENTSSLVEEDELPDPDEPIVTDKPKTSKTGKSQQIKLNLSTADNGEAVSEEPPHCAAPPHKGPTPSEFMDVWNGIFVLTRIASMTAGRVKSLQARNKEAFFRENWREAIARIVRDPFYIGENDRKWKANVDWFLRPDKVAQIVERLPESKPAPKLEEKPVIDAEAFHKFLEVEYPGMVGDWSPDTAPARVLKEFLNFSK